MIEECMKCHEEIFHYLPKHNQEAIISLIKEILYEKGKEKEFNKALKVFRGLQKYYNRKVPVCRYCLVEIFEEISGEELKEIKTAYAFDEV